MLLEFKGFLAQLLPDARWEERVKELFSRNRFLAEAKAFASRLYAQGLTLRKLKDLLQNFGVRVSHVAIWKRSNASARPLKTSFSKHKRRAIVVDETKIRVQDS